MSNLPSTSIQIDRPAPQTTSEVQVPPKAYLNFTFSLTGASSAKQGDDLIIELPDGSKVVCLGYYSNTAEGERPQIAVNGEPLPDTALDLGFTDSHVEGQRIEGALEGRDDQQGEGQTTEGQDGKDQTGDGPASSGATATGDSVDGGLQNAANSGQNAGQSGSTGDSGNTGSSTGSSSGSSSGSSGASGMLNEGAFKQDMNVDFLGGIPRLPGLDLGSDRGFNTTDIEGSAPPPLSWDNNTGATPPPPAEAPVIPSAPLEPSVIFREVGGLKEAGFDADRNPVGQDSTSDRFTFTVPEGTDPADIVLDFSLFPGDPATGDTQYGNITYTVSIDRQVPVLGEDGTPLKDEDGNPVYRTEATVELTYSGLNNTHDDINSLPLGGTLREDVSFDVVVKGTATNPDGTSTTTTTVVGSANVGFIIEGSNDAPTLKPVPDDPSGNVVVGHGEVKEEGVYNDNKNTAGGAWGEYAPGTPDSDPAFGTHKNTTTVQLGVNDFDKGDSHTFTLTTGTNNKPQVSIEGLHSGNSVELVDNGNGNFTLKIDGVDCGTLTLSPSGTLNFTLDSNSSVIQGMKAGEASTIKLNVTVTDRGGLSDAGDVTLTIHGTNDRPTLAITPDADEGITVDAAGNARVTLEESGKNTEADYNSITGTLTGKDVDAGETGDLEFYVAKDPGVAGKPSLDAANDLYPVAGDKTIIDGKYGTLELGKDGVFTYKENGELKGGEVKTETFTVLVKDPNGAFSTKEVTFEVKGKYNDITFAQNTESIQLVEDGVQDGGNAEFAGKILTVQGNIAKDGNGNSTITDPDGGAITFVLQPGDGVTVTSNTTLGGVQTIVTDYGTVVFNTLTGEYTYTLNGAKADALGLNDSLKELFTVQIFKPGADGRPSEVNTDLTLEVNIQGTNDKPELQITTEGGVAVDPETGNGSVTLVEGASTPTTVTGKLAGTDVDNGDQDGLTYYIVKKGDGRLADDNCTDDIEGSQTGAYGTLEVNPNGTFTYKENGSLQPGMTGTDTFTVLVKDAHGAFSTKEIAFTVKGEYVVVGHGEVKEEGVYSGNTTTSEGSWDKYQPGTGENDPAYGTHKGSTTVQLGVHGEDMGGSTFTLTNADNPSITISGTPLGSTAELVKNTDGTYTFKIDGENCGTLTLSPSGTLEFTLNNESSVIQGMKAGDASTIKVNVTVTDKNGFSGMGDVTLTIHGTNDKPTLDVKKDVGDTHITLTEKGADIAITESSQNNAPAKVTGSLQGVDPEGDTVANKKLSFYIVRKEGDLSDDKCDGDTEGTQAGKYGTLVLKPDGTFTYTENGSLRSGETGADRFIVLVKDANGAFSTKELTFNVAGTNSTVQIATGTGNNYVIKLVEAGVLPGGNNPNDSSAPGDMQARPSFSGNITTTPDGNKVIVDNDAVGGPGIANSRTYVLSKSVNGQTNDLDITSTSGPDAAGNQTIVTTYGTFAFNIYTGEYTYTLHEASVIESLNKDDIKTEIFTVTVYKGGVDVGSRDFSVTIRGMNDAPEFTEVNDLDVTAQGTSNTGHLEAGSAATSTDVDNGDTRSYSIEYAPNGKELTLVQAVNGKYGVLYLEPDGTYTYVLDNDREATRALGQNEFGEEVFNIRVTDKAGAYDQETITVKVNGAYDKPTVSYNRVELKEDNGTNSDGSNYNPLSTGEQKITVSTTDTLHKTDQTFALVNGNGSLAAPVENGVQTITTEYGTLTFTVATGSYEYVLSAAGNLLLQGKNIHDVITEHFKVQVTFKEANGGNSKVVADLNVDLRGTNDDPYFVTDSDTKYEITMDRVYAWEKNDPVSGKVAAADTDTTCTDACASPQLMFYFKGTNGELLQTVNTTYGRISIDPETGQYKYSLDPLNAAVQGLDKDDTPLKDTITVWVRDPHGGVAEKEIEITINGKTEPANGNDSYDFVPENLVVKEDGVGDGGMTVNPENPGQEHQSGIGGKLEGTEVIRYCFKTADGQMTQSLKGKYGDIYIDAYTGQYRYVLNNQLEIVQALGALLASDIEKFDVFKFTFSNGTATLGDKAGIIQVTIKGENDAPELSHDTHAGNMNIYAGGSGGKVSGKFSSTDKDELNGQDTKEFSLSIAEPSDNDTTSQTLNLDIDGVKGTVTIDANGNYTFQHTEGSFVGSKTLTFWVFVKDSQGAIDKEQVSITITSANTKPVIISCTYTKQDESAGDPSYAYGNEHPSLDIDHDTGHVQVGGHDVAADTASALTVGITEKTTDLDKGTSITGKFGSWDNEVAHGQAGKFSYFLCDKDGNNLTTLDIGEYGTLSLGKDGAFTFSLNNQADIVKALQEGHKETLTYYLKVRDPDGTYSEFPQKFEITITGTNNQPQITATQTLIKLNESGNVHADYELTLVDPDLFANPADKTPQAGHDFELEGTCKLGNAVDTALTVTETKSGSSYSFVVTTADGGKYGTFYVKVNPNDATDVRYWFEVDPSMDRLGPNDNVTLSFKLTFNDGSGNTQTQISNEAQINVVIQGTNNIPEISVTDADKNIMLTEDETDTSHTLTVTDPDLGTNSSKCQIGLTSTNEETTVDLASRAPDGSTYEYAVTHKGELYGVFHITVDPADPKQVTYTFEIDEQVKDYLFTGDTVKLDFNLTFTDEFGGKSAPADVSVTITDSGEKPTTTTSVSHADSAGSVPGDISETRDATSLPDVHGTNGADTLDADSAALAASATGMDAVNGGGMPATASPSADGALPPPPSLQSPDYVLPGTAPLDSGMTAAGTTTGAEPPLTLETPLPDMPAQDMTSAPGQESLQFQLQTTGV